MKKFNIIRKLLRGREEDDFPSILHRAGFSRGHQGILINRKLNLVVKCSYINKRKPRHCIPTGFLRESSSEFYWVVQPVARLDRKFDALQRINEWHNPDSPYDIHPGNVGWYRNRAVLIDW